MTDLTVIVPVHNEEKNIDILYNELKLELDRINRSYQIIFVDDGSTDNSFNILKRLYEKGKIKIVKLRSNYGQSSAISAGIDQAEGKNIVTMDSDLQHDPKDIIVLLNRLEKGFDVVCGWRKYRNESDSFLGKTIPSLISNFLIRNITKLKLYDTTGGMRIFKKEVIDNISIYGEMHRYLPILANWKGFKVSEAPIHIRKRKHGKTKYNVSRIGRGFLDLLTIKFFVSYSTRPIQIFGRLGITVFLMGLFTSLYIGIRKLLLGISIMEHHQPLLLLSILLLILGINFICFGLIADMISYDAISSQKRKMYIVEKII